jgi:hypothetical protein
LNAWVRVSSAGGISIFEQQLLVSLSAEPVGKAQMANSDNFGIVKNQVLTSHKKLQNGQV